MSNRRSDFRPPEELDELSPQLRELDRYLLLDGVVWRRRLPDADQAARRAVAVVDRPQRPLADPSTLPTAIHPAQHAPVSHPTVSAQPNLRRPSSRTQRLVAIAAAIAIVTLLAALLHSVVPSRQGTTAHTPTPRVTAPASPTQPTATATVPGSWSTLPGFAGKHGVTFADAPQSAYAWTESMSSSTPTKFGPPPLFTLQHTGDGGQTWQNETLPVAEPQSGQSSDYSIMDLFVGPPYANPAGGQLYITMQLGTASLCQPYGGLGKSASYCAVQFVSFDGGATWQHLQLPAVAPNERGDPVLTNHFIVQDKDVYSTIEDFCPCSGASADPRIVVSVNGSSPWHTVDDGLIAKGLGADFVDGTVYLGAAGSTLFAVVEPVDPHTLQPIAAENPPYYPGHLQLYRADNPGYSNAQWTLVGDVPHNFVDSMHVTAVSTGQGAAAVIYLSVSFDATQPNAQATQLPQTVVEASRDGGRTWTTAPSAGIPSGYKLAGGNAGPSAGSIPSSLGDGSVAALFLGPPPDAPYAVGLALFAWKAGGASWRQLTIPSTTTAATTVIVVTAANDSSTASSVVLVSDAGVLTYDPYTLP